MATDTDETELAGVRYLGTPGVGSELIGALRNHVARLDEIKADGVAERALIDAMRTALRVLILTATLAVKIQEAEGRHGRDIGDLKRASAPGRLIGLEARVNRAEPRLAAIERSIGDPVTGRVESEIGAKDRGELAEALDKLARAETASATLNRYIDAMYADAALQRAAIAKLKHERDFGEWRLKLRKDFDDEVKRQAKIHEQAIAREHKRFAELETSYREQALALEVQTKELEQARTQLAAAHAELDASRAHGLRMENAYVAWVKREQDAASDDGELSES